MPHYTQKYNRNPLRSDRDEQGVLWVVGTPIGNLDDMTYRAVATLKSCDCIYAEDTRRARLLMRHFQIQNRLRSLHASNEKRLIAKTLTLVGAGQHIALISDAGMPCIQDPGKALVAAAHQAGYSVRVVPGPSALTAALALCGLNANEMCFIGFLPEQPSKRARRLRQLWHSNQGGVIFVANHDVHALLQQLHALPARDLVLCKEMTKRHECVLLGTAATVLEHLQQTDPGTDTGVPHGEYVLVVAPSDNARADDHSEQDLHHAAELAELLSRQLPRSQSCAIAAAHHGVKRAILYQRLLDEDAPLPRA